MISRQWRLLGGAARRPVLQIKSGFKYGPKFGPRTATRSLIVRDFASNDLFSAGLARLQRSAQQSLSVTEFITQFDELAQIDKFGGLEKAATAQMAEGTRVHEMLDLETALPASQFDLDAVLEAPVSAEVAKFLDLLDKLVALADPQFHSVREMRIRGTAPNGCLLRGIIDGVDVTEQGLVVTETKTTRSRTLSPYQVRLAYHQALTYNWMLRQFLEVGDGSVRSLANLFVFDEAGGLELELITAAHGAELAAADSAIQRLRQVGVAPYVRLQYLKLVGAKYAEETLEVEYSQSVVDDVFRSRIDLFAGRRPAIAGTLREADTQLTIA